MLYEETTGKNIIVHLPQDSHASELKGMSGKWMSLKNYWTVPKYSKETLLTFLKTIGPVETTTSEPEPAPTQPPIPATTVSAEEQPVIPKKRGRKPGVKNVQKTPTVTATPVTATPVTETPVTETPVTETPVAETPVAKTPLADTPVAKTPLADTPVEKTPVDVVPRKRGRKPKIKTGPEPAKEINTLPCDESRTSEDMRPKEPEPTQEPEAVKEEPEVVKEEPAVVKEEDRQEDEEDPLDSYNNYRSESQSEEETHEEGKDDESKEHVNHISPDIESEHSRSDDDICKGTTETYHPRKVIDPRRRVSEKFRRDFVENYVNSDDEPDTDESNKMYEKFKNLFKFYRNYSEEPVHDFHKKLDTLKSKLRIS
jgi:hypothetical protein